jgi:hypothetical protein
MYEDRRTTGRKREEMDQQQHPDREERSAGCSTGCLGSLVGGVVGLLAGIVGALYTVGKEVVLAFVLIPPITVAIGAIGGFVGGVLWRAWRETP